MGKRFKLQADFSPAGDQPQAIERLQAAARHGIAHQSLLGVTGSGKTFTIANVIEKLQRPALVLAPNKTLAAQLYGEMREFFPGFPFPSRRNRMPARRAWNASVLLHDEISR